MTTQTTQPGYQPDGERGWWWRVAQHLDAAQIAAVNAMAHNLDAPAWVLGLQDKLREAQVILLEIFRAKDLLPAPNGHGNGAPNGHGQPLPPPPPPPTAPPPLDASDEDVVADTQLAAVTPEPAALDEPPAQAVIVTEEMVPAAEEPSPEATT